MSYDLHVYAATPAADLAALAEAAGLHVEAADGAAGATLTRGARRRFCCNVDGPDALEPEDVPDDVVAAVLGPCWVYTVLVEGTVASEVPHAVRFARRLADATGGAVYDPQTGEVWTRGRARRAPQPPPPELVDVVEMEWYVRADDAPPDTAARWLDTARRTLPEALPRRFGGTEPLQGRLDRDGDAAFAAAAAQDTVFLRGTPPCFGGSLSSGRWGVAGGVRAHSLTLDRSALREPRWAAAARAFFVEFAVAAGASFAAAEVRRRVHWSGRSLGYTADTEETVFLARRGAWYGLPPYPVWWSWYGAVYEPLAEPHLTVGEVERRPTGLFHAASAEPLARDELAALLPRRGLRRQRAEHWLPADLRARELPGDPRVSPKPVGPAERVPAPLRGLRPG